MNPLDIRSEIWRRSLVIPEYIDYFKHIHAIKVAEAATGGVLLKKGVLKNFTKFTGKHLYQSLLFNKVAALLKRRHWHRCFPVNFVKFLRAAFLQNTSGRLLLKLIMMYH